MLPVVVSFPPVVVAAGQTDDAPSLLVFVFVALVFYFLSCLVRPWKRCIACNDRKKFPHKSRTFRLCPRCNGRGREFRTGTRIVRGVFGFGFSKFH